MRENNNNNNNNFHSIYHRLSSVLHILHGWSGPSTSNERVWVGRHPRCRPLFELTRLAGGPGGTDNILHVSEPMKRRVEPGAFHDLVVIGKIADEDVNDLLLGFVDIDRSQAGKQLVHPGKNNGVLIHVVGDGFELPL